MDRHNSVKQLDDAEALIRMLEQLMKSYTDSLDTTFALNSGIPWAGIQITLRQARELIQRARTNELSNGGEELPSTRDRERRRDFELAQAGAKRSSISTGPAGRVRDLSMSTIG